MTRSNDNDLLSGLIRLHVLHHAAEGDVFGFFMIKELRRHGYRISAGTLYPMLHRMQKRGLLSSDERVVQGRNRRVYRITPSGRSALKVAKQKVGELFGELFEEEKSG